MRIIASYERDWWIGPNTSAKWNHTTGFGGKKAFEFDREFARSVGSAGIEIRAWVRHTNDTILLTHESIWCHFIEELKTDESSPASPTLKDIFLMMLIGSVLFGTPLGVQAIFYYKLRSQQKTKKAH
ncbi:MAG: hypothetical protein ACFFC6_07460 [Promethearchaeota archaeon]